MMVAVKPEIAGQGFDDTLITPEDQEGVEAGDGQLLLNVTGKRDLRFLYDMLYNNHKPRAVPRPST